MRPRIPALAWSVVGFGVAAVALTLLAAIEKAPLPGDPPIARHIQSSGVLDALAPTVNSLGDWRWAALLATLLLTGIAVCGRRQEKRGTLARIVPFVAVAMLWPGATLLKEAVQSRRPNGADGLFVDYFRTDYGFPSGHVYGDVLVYGFIAVAVVGILPRQAATVVQTGCVAIIVLAGVARVSVGAHWPSDALGGYLWGAAALSLVVMIRRFLLDRAGLRGVLRNRR